MYIGPKDETFNELKPKLDHGDGVGGAGDGGLMVETCYWVFFFPENYSENKLLRYKQDLCV
ncbi:hypothetical protein HID58_095028 [Brassica napus]|uniref:Uncharacterized protein n=1 Tax=Brassica napus TaxID=3708 RepID=A0ABQ7X5F4_BRANA|nr:hypothetical protein HID58_095028 [Brassica napus]